jgi:mannose-6-phosphate isomerase-like protein (cupin superfamily)
VPLSERHHTSNKRHRAQRRGRFQRTVYPVERLVLSVRLEDREPFVTADGSTIREIAGLPSGNAIQQSLAEATVLPGAETVEHFHRETEEIYHFVAGAGRMRLGPEEAPVRAGDTVVIAPGITHKLWNTGDEPLVLLCCCAPPYSHEDTVLTEH